MRRDRADEGERRRPAVSLASRCPVEPKRCVRHAGAVESRAGELAEPFGVDLREAEPFRRGGESRDVIVEPERPATVDAQGLEGGTASEKRVVVRPQHRLVRGHESAPPDGQREQGHRQAGSGSGAPTASASGRALTQDSSISASGRESQTTPPPAQRWTRPAAAAKVRIVRARSRSPFGRTTPSAPIEAPRPTGSSAAMWSIAAIFGAPVIDPPGNVASISSAKPTPSLSRPSTVETMWTTPASS